MADPDWNDPCAVLEWLRPQAYKVIAGVHVVRLRHGDGEREFSRANSRDLGAFMRQLESECATKQGKRRRFAKGVRWR
jgi:hypothetical protein